MSMSAWPPNQTLLALVPQTESHAPLIPAVVLVHVVPDRWRIRPDDPTNQTSFDAAPQIATRLSVMAPAEVTTVQVVPERRRMAPPSPDAHASPRPAPQTA